MQFWRQNIKKEDRSRKMVHQRGAVWFAEDQWSGASVHWEVCLPGRCGAEIRLDYDDEPLHIAIHFLWLFSLYLSINAALARRLRDRYDPKRKDGKPSYEGCEWSFDVHADCLRWNIGRQPHSWSNTDGWRNSSFYFWDWILGRHQYTSETLQRPVEVCFTFPEGPRTGTVELTRDTWKRKRWPFTKAVYRAKIELPKPPMFAGKGENSWDCDDDAIYGMSCRAKTVREAITAYEETVYRNRARYGQPHEVIAG